MRLDDIGALFHLRRERIEQSDRSDADDEGDCDRWQEKLPDGDPSRPRHDQFEPAGQFDESRHGAEEHAKRQHLLGHRGRPQKGQEGDEAHRNPRPVACPAQHFDEINDIDHAADGQEDQHDRVEKTHREIAGERCADHALLPD